ncbi:DNA-binding protein [Methanococcoides methylutens]|uniref:DNA-binding protein n=1 Tax=Methanococcoides methylutens TaxID=2226 RepID=UPI0040440EBE
MVDDLEAIRRKRLAEMQQQQASPQMENDAQAAYQQEQAQAERDAQVQAVLRQIMTPEARERLTRLKLSRKELAEQLESQLVMLAQNGRLQSMIDDDKLKLLLTQMQPQKRKTSITRM